MKIPLVQGEFLFKVDLTLTSRQLRNIMIPPIGRNSMTSTQTLFPRLGRRRLPRLIIELALISSLSTFLFAQDSSSNLLRSFDREGSTSPRVALCEPNFGKLLELGDCFSVLNRYHPAPRLEVILGTYHPLARE
jgi:hypothetical protein